MRTTTWLTLVPDKWVNYGNSFGIPSVTVIPHNGLCVVEGLVRDGPWGSKHTVATLPPECVPRSTNRNHLIFSANNNRVTVRLDVARTNNGGEIKYAAVVGGSTWISLAGIAFTTDAAPPSKTLPLAEGWINYGVHWAHCRYTVLHDGVCVVEGLPKNEFPTPYATQQWNAIAHLPPECRPAKRTVFHLNHHSTAHRVDVLRDGTIMYVAGSKIAKWVSLSGIRFRVAGRTAELVPLETDDRWYDFGNSFARARYSLHFDGS